MIAAWCTAGLLVVLVVIQMARPRFERSPRMSAARFFAELPPPQRRMPLLRWSSPWASRPFYLQLLILVLALVAMLSTQSRLTVGTARQIGTWLIVDTSASMSTRQGVGTRFEVAQQAAEQAIGRAQDVGRGLTLCWRVSAFDLERRDLLVTRDPAAARDKIAALTPRPLGTDLGLLHALPKLLVNPAESDCPITHLVILSDQPAPDWLSQPGWPPVIWQDIGMPADNIGFTRIQSLRHPLTGLVYQVGLEITAFGQVPAGAVLQITRPEDAVEERLANWTGDGTWQEHIAAVHPGQYALRLSPGGAYGYDDRAVIEVGDAGLIRVDWQLADRRLFDLLIGTGSWIEDHSQPQLRVTAWPAQIGDVPTLLVGEGLETPPVQREILDFYEPSPLLADLNLDVAESIGIVGEILPEEFIPVLRGLDVTDVGRVWLAQHSRLLAAYVPGLPELTDNNTGQFSITAFFNAVRWLLQTRPAAPLYTLTTPTTVEPVGNRLALHEDEGNTVRPPRSLGSLDDLQPTVIGEVKRPIWPLLLTLVAALYLLERALASWGGPAWR